MGLISALVGADAEAQRKESNQLLSRQGNIPNQEFARSAAQREFTALAAKQTPIRILDVVTEETQSGTGRGHDSAALMQVVVRQTMSVDLLRLRIHLRAKLVSADRVVMMDQNVLYLPTSIDGVTKEDALRNWTEYDYRRYREHVEKGMAGAVDALNGAVFSRVNYDPGTLPDAQALLKRTSCFGGDYDAGIPMSAYQAGRILPTRPGVTAMQLRNGDILVFPQCGG
jgi:hypothetical protein